MVKYNDRYLRIILAVIAAHIMVRYNEPDSTFEAFFTPSYYRGMAGSLVIAFLLITYIYYLTVRLDKKFDWHEHTIVRLGWQSLLGFLLPALLAFAMAAAFFAIYDINILDTAYLRQDFILVLFMLSIINIYYFALNSFLRVSEEKVYLSADAVPQVEIADNGGSRELIIVDTHLKSIPIRQDMICWCFILEGTVFIRTAGMASITESYALAGNLKDLEDQLDKRYFFRINRKMIIHINTCKYFAPGKNKTLELTLDPPPYRAHETVPKEHARLNVVSEDRVASFKLWINR